MEIKFNQSQKSYLGVFSMTSKHLATSGSQLFTILGKRKNVSIIKIVTKDCSIVKSTKGDLIVK